MTLQTLNTRYEQKIRSAQQELMAGFAQIIGAKSVKFVGHEQYNDEEYYDELGELEIDGESITDNYHKICEIAQKLGLKIKEQFDEKYPEDSASEAFAELREELANSLPSFINEGTSSYDAI